MARWSKLQKRIESLFDPEINLRVRCIVYQKPSYYNGTRDTPRLYITLGKEIIFDFIKDFKDDTFHDPSSWNPDGVRYHYWLDVMFINDLIREYTGTPKDKIIDQVFENDLWGLSDILKAADRRIGKNKLMSLYGKTSNEAVKKIITARLKGVMVNS